MRLFSFYSRLFFAVFVSTALNSSCQPKPKDQSFDSNKSKRILNNKPDLQVNADSFLVPIGYVSDYEGLYSPDEIYRIDSTLSNFEKKENIQIVIVTLDEKNTSSSEFEKLISNIGNTWKVGGDSSYGIVIGISKQYKMMRIQNGKKLKRFLTDDETKVIIDKAFIPEFKNSNYFAGTLNGLLQLLETIQNNIQHQTKVTF